MRLLTSIHLLAPMRNLHRVVLGMGPYMMNQWSGINSISKSLVLHSSKRNCLLTQLSNTSLLPNLHIAELSWL